MNTYLRRLQSALGATITLAVTVIITAPGHAQTAPTARPGEIVVRAALTASQADITASADRANCTVVRAIPYFSDFYLLRLKNVAPSLTEVPVSQDMQTSLAKLQADPVFTSADPNFMRHITWMRGDRRGVRKAGTLATPVTKTRATAPPSLFTVTPNDPLYSRQWGLRAIRMPEAWAIQAGMRSVVVGDLDTGIDSNHPDFKLPDGTGSVILGGQNFVTGQAVTDFSDPTGHGTHTAGTIAATTNNSTPTGVAGVAGWNRGGVTVRLRIGRIANAAGGIATADEIAGIGYMIANNVDVVNMSFGGLGASSATELAAINQMLAAKITICAAAGNDGVQGNFFPADYPGVIKVTAVQTDLKLTTYSNFGGPVTIAAPGGNGDRVADNSIWSTWPLAGGTEGPGVNGYNAIDGTSMATPHVTGAVALLLAAGATRDPVFIKAAIQAGARALPDEVPQPAGGSGVKYGAGLLDVYSSLLPFADPPFSVSVPEAAVPVTGDLTSAYSDRGPTYTPRTAPITLTAVGVTHLPAQSAITVEVQTATTPSSVIRTLVGGIDFVVPTTVPTGQPKGTPISFTVPGITLPAGRYKIVVKYQGTPIGSIFQEVLLRSQPQGRTLFAVPFLVRADPAGVSAPEQAILGPSAQFTLARYNPLRLPSDSDYALFQSTGTGRRDAAASFSATAPDGTPIVYQTSAPSVSIAPVGLGYWLNLDRPVTLTATGPEVTTPVAIRLFASNGGWNLIGSPFTATTSWGTATVQVNGANGGGGTVSAVYSMEEAIAAGIISNAVIGYRNGDYFYGIYPNGTLEPFNGYWVRAYRECTLIIAPASTGRAVTTRAAELPKSDGWRVRFGANVAGDRDGQNYFGVSQNGLSIPKPPSGAGHAYVRFVTETTPGRSVAQAFDMRIASGNAPVSWTAAVSTDKSNADVTLSWDGLGGVPNRSDLVLTDTVTGKTVDMRSRSAYTFRSGEAGSTRSFKITAQSRLSAGPLMIQNVTVVGGGRAQDSGMSVRFTTSRDADVTGVVKSLNGTIIGELTGTNRATATGPVTLRWNGRSRAGSPVPPGAYLVEITARATDGTQATYRQPVQNLK